uniref:Uncharacterized protein n=2 Tax=Dunaliella tertiolecta TaxID=3047 RepID=A0A7S3QPC8_DUNTE
MFLGDAAIHADVVDAAAAVLAGQAGPNAEAALRVADCSSRVLQSAHAYVKQQREAQTLAFESRPGEHTSCAASAFLGGKQGRFCRLSLSVAYCSPPSAAPVAHQSVCEPCMVDITPSHTLDLGKMLAGHVPGPSLQPDDTSAWMLPLLQHAAASTAALGAGCTLFQEGGVTCQATQVYLAFCMTTKEKGEKGSEITAYVMYVIYQKSSSLRAAVPVARWWWAQISWLTQSLIWHTPSQEQELHLKMWSFLT